ncbi:MAG TPA: MBL fold metallo-hydrolase [Myxococcota bacterium]|jgi:L-ascorbate metabolism protein UlaG (beta-lactamase superfamily)
MELGFETIGNASIVCHDRRPILVTDPWLEGSAYFGSWILSHQVPPQQLEAIRSCEYVWYSHGHPDHLNAGSFDHLRGAKILVPDHYGQRIFRDLKEQGLDVHVAPDRSWVPLSDRIRIQCISDYNQDAVLLIDIGGCLLIDLNDAHDRGWDRLVRKIAAGYERVILLALTGYGDAYMINYHDETGAFIPPVAARRLPVGPQIAELTRRFGADRFVPFSSMHKYQREDSVRMNQYATRLEDYPIGFESSRAELLPAFIRYDCRDHGFERIDPPENPDLVVAPAEFGDDWQERLEPAEVEKVSRYFRSFDHLADHLDFVTLRVGGRDHVVELARRGFHRGIRFEVPRGSLLTAVEYQVFDDLLIGNFMKTTLHGRWPATQIYPHFEPFVTKYGDNGGARTREELAEYFRWYRQRAPLEYLLHRFEARSREVFRDLIPERSPLYQIAKRSYLGLKKAYG